MTFKDYFLTEGIDEKLPFLVKQFGDLPNIQSYVVGWGRSAERVIDTIIKDSDPTYPNADYATWILRMVKSGSIRLGGEDFEKVKERLEQFHNLKKTPRFKSQRDINQYKSYADLAQTIDEHEGVTSKGEEVRIKQTNGVKLQQSAKNLSVYEVTTPEACAKLFRHTEWCVKDPTYSRQYLEKGPLYFFTKDNKAYALLHFPTGQFLDSYDQQFADYGIFKPLVLWFKQHLSDIPGEYSFWPNIIADIGLKDEYLAMSEAKFKRMEIDDGILYQTCLRFGATSEALEKSIIRDNADHVGMITRYAFYCKNGKWPEGEKKLLSMVKDKFDDVNQNLGHEFKGIWDATKAVNLLQVYTVAVRKKVWPEAEALIKQYPKLAPVTNTYWKYVHNGLADLKTGKLSLSKLNTHVLGGDLPMILD